MNIKWDIYRINKAEYQEKIIKNFNYMIVHSTIISILKHNISRNIANYAYLDIFHSHRISTTDSRKRRMRETTSSRTRRNSNKRYPV